MLKILVEGSQVSEVSPYATSNVVAYNVILVPSFVEAVDENGEIIYSRAFGWHILDEFPRDRKIVIAPTEKDPYLPLEIENRTKYKLYIHLCIDDVSACIGGLESGQSMKKRPLPSDLYTYTIKAITYEIDKSSSNTSRTTGYDIIYQKEFSRTELEKENWKIIIGNP